jgi:hypothetical protein
LFHGCPERLDRFTEFTAEQLWKVFACFVQQYRFVLGEERTPPIANRTDKIVCELGDILIQQQQVHPDVEHRLGTSGF